MGSNPAEEEGAKAPLKRDRQSETGEMKNAVKPMSAGTTRWVLWAEWIFRKLPLSREEVPTQRIGSVKPIIRSREGSPSMRVKTLLRKQKEGHGKPPM